MALPDISSVSQQKREYRFVQETSCLSIPTIRGINSDFVCCQTKGYIWFRVLVCSAIRFLRDTETTLKDKILISYLDACCNQYNNDRQTNHIGSSRTISKLIYSDLRPPRFFCPTGGCRHIVQSSQSSASKSWLQAGTEQSRGKPQT